MAIGRRQFISALGGTAVAWPLAADAQQAAMPVIGFLGSANNESERHLVAAFRDGLAEGGYVAGKNVFIAHQTVDGRYNELPMLAADFIRQNVVILVGSGPRAALAAKSATSTTPVLFVIGYDPVQYGLVSSINHPGGNATGATFFTGLLAPKRLELLNQLVPGSSKMVCSSIPKVRLRRLRCVMSRQRRAHLGAKFTCNAPLRTLICKRHFLLSSKTARVLS